MGDGMIIELRLGAFCAPLSEQLPPGLVADEPLTHLQRDADAITRLKVRGLLTDAEVAAAQRRLIEKIKTAAKTR
jgi:hypothetical protein